MRVGLQRLVACMFLAFQLFLADFADRYADVIRRYDSRKSAGFICVVCLALPPACR